MSNESKINPIISVWHLHTVSSTKIQNNHCEKMLYVWKHYPQRDGGRSKLIVSMGSRCQAIQGGNIPQQQITKRNKETAVLYQEDK